MFITDFLPSMNYKVLLPDKLIIKKVLNLCIGIACLKRLENAPKRNLKSDDQ